MVDFMVFLVALATVFNSPLPRGADTVYDIGLPSSKMIVEPNQFDAVLECTAYWYMDPVDASGTGITCTGNKCIPGKTLAVDPKVIPLGSRVYFHRTGETYVADDTGSAIKGYMGDRATASENEAVTYGRRNEHVTVLLPYPTKVRFVEVTEPKVQDKYSYFGKLKKTIHKDNFPTLGK